MEAKGTSLEQQIIDFFYQLGYRVIAPRFVPGNSGSSQKFDISAVKGDEEIVLDIASAREVGPEAVVAFVAKIFDTRPKRPILVCVPALSHDAKSLVTMYKIETVTARDTHGVLLALSNIFASEQS